MSTFLPLLDEENTALSSALGRIGPIIRPFSPSLVQQIPDRCYLFVEHLPSPLSLDNITSWLDGGVEKLIIPLLPVKELIGEIPSNRLILLLDVANVSAVSDTVRNGVSGVLLKTPVLDRELISSVSQFFSGSTIYVLSTSGEPPSNSTNRELSSIGAIPVLPTSQLTLGTTTSTKLNIADAFLAPIISDRPDGLIPTIVSSETGHSLGLVYSSPDSVKESILTGKGVYQSRKHGIWRKGETSGATQDIISIRVDCDTDSLEFKVVQHGAGFCHLNRQSCFGEASGISALEKTLLSRLESAPEGSYTLRLFNDPELLRSKIMEEADELCQANSKEHIALEAADLLYFALTKCIASGVRVADIERSLDQKAKKITRRPGNAKPQWLEKSGSVPQKTPSTVIAEDAPIRMRTSDLSAITPTERAQLFKRPVLKYEEMITKVKPIVDDVRKRGDKALLELTAKFDHAQLTSPVLLPPFSPEMMQIDDKVREAIDVAYSNIYKFHEAQFPRREDVLNVETMSGVVCTRFSRCIDRVGLYVPGGTAILPSTALMLGVPAKVAGCREIVIATPPRPDGSISPEVMYVAKLVGASAILKAGGAQAIAAMAYGTGTVPKVDKILGPGNQWVTVAKMLVQNDTDALVSIDMPAGPSEVLVIADHTADPTFVAADLLSQAEHGVDSQVVLIAVDLTADQLSAIEKEVDVQAHALSRVDIVRQSIGKSVIVKCQGIEEAIKFSNDYAPEHLILQVERASRLVDSIDNAGSVFVGPYTPESCGDYASGTNHTLPTNGYARQFSGVNTASFRKYITCQEITAEGLKNIGPYVATLADCEGLEAHANAVRIRLRG